MTAAIYTTRKGLQTLIIGKDLGGQVAKSGEIDNYLGFGMSSGVEVTSKFVEHVNEYENLEHKDQIWVKDLVEKEDGFTVKTDQGDFEAKTIIIATGRVPRLLGVPGENEYKNKGVTYCEVCDAPLFRGKLTAVIGGGNSGLEATLSLSALCPKVYLLNLTGDLTGDVILKNKVQNKNNIEVINNARTIKIEGDKFVKSLTYEDLATKEEKKIEVEGVFIEVGYIPSSEFDRLTKKDLDNRIEIDINCKTSVSGIFACGDVTNIRDNQIVIAAGEGAKAALSAYQYLTQLH